MKIFSVDLSTMQLIGWRLNPINGQAQLSWTSTATGRFFTRLDVDLTAPAPDVNGAMAKVAHFLSQAMVGMVFGQHAVLLRFVKLGD